MTLDSICADDTRASWQGQPTRILGRERELTTIERVLAGDDVHLLTLVGPAGVGKTRLATEVGLRLNDNFPDGAVLVDLASVRHPDRVPFIVAQAVGLQDPRDSELLLQIQEHLGERSALIVLDNFEHVLPAAAQVAALLSACNRIKLLITSRAPLHLRWEHTLRIAPLTVPDPGHLGSLSELTEIPSVALFLERVQASNPEFMFTERNARAVAELCVHLDGLPLAIELAAARALLLSPRMMVDRMEQRLSLLRWDAPDLPERQQTLRAAIDWSYELLSEDERILFRHLAVFAGGFDLEAAEAIAAGLPESPLDVLEGLTSLVEKSLVQVTGLGEERVPYSLLESIREYGREMLEEHGEFEAARQAHAGYYRQLAERAETPLRGQGQDEWLSRLERERDNLHAALRWLLDRGENENALRLATALGYFWVVRGHLVEGSRWLGEALEKAPDAHPGVRSGALAQAGLVLIFKGDYQQSKEILEESLRLASEIHASTGIARSITYLSLRAALAGDWDESAGLLHEALDIWEQLGTMQDLEFTLRYLSAASFMQQTCGQAASLLSDVLDRLPSLPENRASGLACLDLALTVRKLGDLPRAAELVQDGLRTSVICRDQRLLSLAVEAGLRLAGEHAEPDMRARLSGARDALNASTGVTQSMWEQWSARRDALIRAQLEREGWEEAYHDGRYLSFDEVVVLTSRMLESCSQQVSSSKPAPPRPSKHSLLSAREHEVLRLVAEGLSSKVIGGQLFISPSTVNYHLTSIFNKLGVNTRAQAVATAAERDLL
jgi:non-specific serine/threonine protein kinase